MKLVRRAAMCLWRQVGHKPGILLGILWTWKTLGILRKFWATLGKNCNKNSVTVCGGFCGAEML